MAHNNLICLLAGIMEELKRLGMNTFAGIVLYSKSAEASTDTAIIVLSRGAAGVSEAGLKLGALTLADVKAKLLSVGIKVLTAI